MKKRLQTFGYTASNLPQAAQFRLEEGEENHVQYIYIYHISFNILNALLLSTRCEIYLYDPVWLDSLAMQPAPKAAKVPSMLHLVSNRAAALEQNLQARRTRV